LKGGRKEWGDDYSIITSNWKEEGKGEKRIQVIIPQIKCSKKGRKKFLIYLSGKGEKEKEPCIGEP